MSRHVRIAAFLLGAGCEDIPIPVGDPCGFESIPRGVDEVSPAVGVSGSQAAEDFGVWSGAATFEGSTVTLWSEISVARVAEVVEQTAAPGTPQFCRPGETRLVVNVEWDLQVEGVPGVSWPPGPCRLERFADDSLSIIAVADLPADELGPAVAELTAADTADLVAIRLSLGGPPANATTQLDISAEAEDPDAGSERLMGTWTGLAE